MTPDFNSIREDIIKLKRNIIKLKRNIFYGGKSQLRQVREEEEEIISNISKYIRILPQNLDPSNQHLSTILEKFESIKDCLRGITLNLCDKDIIRHQFGLIFNFLADIERIIEEEKNI